MSCGFAAARKGNYKQAFKQFQAAVRRAEASNDDERLETALTALGAAYVSHEVLSDDTRDILLRALSIGERIYDGGHPSLAKLHCSLAVYYCAIRNFEQAVNHFENVLGHLDSVENKVRILYLEKFIECRIEQGNYCAAEELWKRAHVIRLEEYGENSLLIAWALRQYRDLLLRMGRREEAEQTEKEYYAVGDRWYESAKHMLFEPAQDAENVYPPILPNYYSISLR